jgi:hypothetical protein
MNVKHVQFERKQIGRKEYEIMKTILLTHLMMTSYLSQMVHQQLQQGLTILILLRLKAMILPSSQKRVGNQAEASLIIQKQLMEHTKLPPTSNTSLRMKNFPLTQPANCKWIFTISN